MNRKHVAASSFAAFVAWAGIAPVAAAATSTEVAPAQTPGAPASGQADGTGAPVEKREIRAVFSCEGGKTIRAVFHTGKQNNVRLMLSDGRKLKLPQTVSGSGARYASENEVTVFWNKGDTAFLEERGQTTYRGCVAQK